ncbi:lytic polysaccharide monooxygenase [Streptomyces sp. ISL-10]|uniref:lytic polysaccharide monooxygenase n=1 Tax=Streptomyces sp. ISL-10 TaxID=2819172 RepID=UPI00203642A8|nr:lytic polysaccharide monooxygenase [Streptomyces sp. ISL-10]
MNDQRRHHATRAGATAAVLAGVVPLLLTGLAAGPAQAHGAPVDPVSRVAACGPQGGELRTSAACRAALAANGGVSFDAWDNLRLPDVRGRDREAIPDGRLCSAGLDAYRGLDTARADWPATQLTAGAPFTLTYRSTIPHQGTFSLYLTEAGHDPAAPLRWSDLQNQPFATATDLQPTDGAYRVSGRLPDGLTGRHVLYTVWRNTDTPDTYYSCSDVVIVPADDERQDLPAQPEEPPANGPGTGPAEPGEPQAPSAPADPESAVPPTTPAPPSSAAPRPAPASAGRDTGSTPGILVGGGAAALALASLCGSLALRRRRL